MPRTNDMVPPATTKGQPVPIRPMRRDMIHKVAHSEQVGLLDTDTWMMARSYEEKRTLVSGMLDPSSLIIAWCGGRWTDFFEFQDDDPGCWEALLSALTPRRSVMLTEEELAAVQDFRNGNLGRPTGKRTARTA